VVLARRFWPVSFGPLGFRVRANPMGSGPPYANVCVCVGARVCVCTSVCFVCIHMWVPVFVCARVCALCVSICGCLCLCVHECVLCVYPYVRACVWGWNCCTLSISRPRCNPTSCWVCRRFCKGSSLPLGSLIMACNTYCRMSLFRLRSVSLPTSAVKGQATQAERERATHHTNQGKGATLVPGAVKLL